MPISSHSAGLPVCIIGKEDDTRGTVDIKVPEVVPKL